MYEVHLVPLIAELIGARWNAHVQQSDYELAYQLQ